MNIKLLPLLKCPSCGKGDLSIHLISLFRENEADEAIVHCKGCASWYPIEHGVLELLTAPLWYIADREQFFKKYTQEFNKLNLSSPHQVPATDISGFEAQTLQQKHFDWYAANDTQSYNSYEETPFWKAEDDFAFNQWKEKINPGSLLLDVGSAQGRSAFPFKDLDLDIIGLDISKKLVAQSVNRYRTEPCKARYTFIVADASNLPITTGKLDYVVIYGVLHHLPDPGETCREVHRVLKDTGVYFGSENHESFLRKIFDFMMKLKPLWYEEAGAEPLLSKKKFENWFGDLKCEKKYYYSVFLPPHVFNFFSHSFARKILHFTDVIGNTIPGLKKAGGLILIEMRK